MHSKSFENFDDMIADDEGFDAAAAGVEFDDLNDENSRDLINLKLDDYDDFEEPVVNEEDLRYPIKKLKHTIE